jgi:hypothetical protein
MMRPLFSANGRTGTWYAQPAFVRFSAELAVIEQRQLDPSAHIRDVRLIEDHLGCVLPVVLEFAILRQREHVVARIGHCAEDAPVFSRNGPG